jgi:Tol biopolymer transport system component
MIYCQRRFSMTSKRTLQRCLWIVLISLLVACGTFPQEQTVNLTETNVPVFTPVMATDTPPGTTNAIASPTAAQPTVPPRVMGKQPPACAFPLAQITAVEPTPEEYTFSEPKVVLTAPKGNLYGIVEWLPDNQQVLMTENLRNNYVENNRNDPQQSISLYNPEKGKSKVYAIRAETNEPPSWHPGLKAVVYPILNYFDIDRQNHTYKFTRQIWVSYGNPDTVQILVDNLPQLPFAIKPDGSEMLYLSDKKISKLDKSLKELPPISLDLAQWDYAQNRRDDRPVSYKMAWQPGTTLIFLYSEGGNGEGGYTFILDTDSGHVCELNLDGWAETAHWSSDGRYLAFIRSTNYAYPTYSAELTLLDSITGNLTTLTVIPQEVEWEHYVQGFTWAPDNRHLLAIGNIFLPRNSQGERNDQWLLYLVDGISGQSVNVEPEYKNFTSSANNSLAWSPDGSKLVTHCQAQYIDQICLISVQRVGQ